MKWSATLDLISDEAARLSPQRAVLTLVTAPLFAVGWFFGMVFVGAAFLWSAGVIGFRQAQVSTRSRGE